MKMNRDQFILLVFALIILLLGAGTFLWQNIKNNHFISSLAITGPLNNNLDPFSPVQGTGLAETNSLEEKESQKILVHVAGEVINSGVYELERGARVIDALMAAGGATSLANLDLINLAAPISDGEKIYIPSVIEKLNQLYQGGSTASSSSSGGAAGKININTADATELQKLSGIGPGKAKSIIDYRTKNGPFKSVDDLLQVSGIGEKTLEKIRDEIVVR
ncbi:MAG TPA: ComEA family DNA-binding protein [Halanaerobiaceae bacterium]|jgi:competence protein ComEA|nr:helix-hairpin-helix domain-containing protein [Bacillota bacterium]HHU91760.1 ComEA family DNA-binding protein [Halanaerobiaceae bacterium]HOA40380.1 helix-hairpin-helix domain-containing protein [Halanaerobiales bacterium]HPZ63669.1 helix-hairpin-helix domain-containing protein [Halanaerobiales bacterium]HQD04938.1 helix-hairpin-helix domain-containing protein [Halanaerobiales bacterium]